MGYILVAAFALLLLAFAFGMLMRSGPRTGRRPEGMRPVQVEQPSADAPTPDRSATAPAAKADAARRVTPPA
jgi:hypothetical protein